MENEKSLTIKVEKRIHMQVQRFFCRIYWMPVVSDRINVDMNPSVELLLRQLVNSEMIQRRVISEKRRKGKRIITETQLRKVRYYLLHGIYQGCASATLFLFLSLLGLTHFSRLGRHCCEQLIDQNEGRRVVPDDKINNLIIVRVRYGCRSGLAAIFEHVARCLQPREEQNMI